MEIICNRESMPNFWWYGENLKEYGCGCLKNSSEEKQRLEGTTAGTPGIADSPTGARTWDISMAWMGGLKSPGK